MSIVSKVKSNPKLKKIALSLLIPKNENSPRLWVKLFLNPFKHKKGANAVVKSRTRMDVFPFNGFTLGANSVIEDFATINNGVGDVNIGDHSFVGIGNVVIGPVNIGNHVIIAQNVVMSGLNHGYEDVTIPPSLQKVTTKAINIEDDVWIGANCTVVAGVTIGKHSVVGAGSVVTKDVPEFSVVVGNPAKVIKKYDFKEQAWKKV
ncbi:acyltransferase [Mucilaginibacter corticis]|uniref:Acyltransferase n=1 Tax=Mucilaginibacter corticis TaxID=2597670 RepID=A0A556MLL8_9SPHI|nr:acyltransferase [Mucilaginibacter corticis]TSJ40745.1 acyltransferase [Mucilaginibacter corticis]